MTLHARIGVQRGSLWVDVDFTVRRGQTLALLGPNGAGKSTVLRVLAGLLHPQQGRIRLGDVVLDDPAARQHTPPYRRPVGMVFQDYLLFPHLSVTDNVAFSLRSRGIGKRQARQHAEQWLDRIGLADYRRSRPNGLSGGQAQRAALARALVGRPELLLLDEPLSALDARTRLTVRAELRRHLTEFEGPAIVVTHDPIDALALADDVAVLEHGRIVQAGPALEVARRPRTDYVARLVGVSLIAGTGDGTAVRTDTGALLTAAKPVTGQVYAAIRPEHVSLYIKKPHGSPRNVWPARLVSATPYGTTVRCELDGPVTLTADITAAAFTELRLAPDSAVWVSVKAQDIEIYQR